MIERHVTFDVFPDKSREFEELFELEYRPAMKLMPGFVKVELLQNQEEPHKYQMTIRFNSLEEAAAWRSSDAHQALKPKLKSLYSSNLLQVFDVIG